MSKKEIPTPNLLAEFMALVLKVFLIIIVLNNVAWSIFVFKPSTPRIGDTHVEITQSGNRDISQEIKN